MKSYLSRLKSDFDDIEQRSKRNAQNQFSLVAFFRMSSNLWELPLLQVSFYSFGTWVVKPTYPFLLVNMNVMVIFGISMKVCAQHIIQKLVVMNRQQLGLSSLIDLLLYYKEFERLD